MSTIYSNLVGAKILKAFKKFSELKHTDTHTLTQDNYMFYENNIFMHVSYAFCLQVEKAVSKRFLSAVSLTNFC